MRPRWFGMSCAYSIAKYNMSMCALGMAEEFSGEVAVNTIWPLNPIWVRLNVSWLFEYTDEYFWQFYLFEILILNF